MIRIVFAFAALYFISCNYKSKVDDLLSDSKRVELHLIDSLGSVVFECPDRYDTSFFWTHFSDCNTCHDQKYRFQSKQAVILKETGWAWTAPTDSIDRFTIYHKLDLYNISTDTSKGVISHVNFKENLAYEKRSMRMIRDTMYTINDRYFSVFALEGIDSLQKKEVVGVTNIRGNDVIFDCELITGKKDSISSGFITNSINLINSIIIREGK